jgi:hypothetical protein
LLNDCLVYGIDIGRFDVFTPIPLEDCEAIPDANSDMDLNFGMGDQPIVITYLMTASRMGSSMR